MAIETESAPAPQDATPPPGGARRDDGRRRLALAAVLLPLALVVIAGGLRFYRLDRPERIYFDEVYYTEDAAQYLEQGVEEGFAVHPPLGKWVIAAGIAALGEGPWGWRAPGALMGTATVLLTYLAGLRLFRRRGVAALAAFLLAVDGLAFTMSRVAMLDATLGFFVMLGFWLLLIDRERLWSGLPATAAEDGDGERPRPLPRRPRTFRWLAGLAFGLALATKWSGLLAIGAAGLFLLGSELAFRRRTTGTFLAGWPRIVTGTGLTMVAVPALVYVVSYAGWFANFEHTRLADEPCPYTQEVCGRPVQRIVRSWLGEQAEILRFHVNLEAEHPYRSLAVGWPVLERPVAYYYASCSDELLAAGECEVAQGNVAEVLGIGNPPLWWLALLAYPGLLIFGVLRRQWAGFAIGVFLLGQYLPWLVASRPAFLFYMTPVVPFIALAVAYAAWQAARPPLLRWIPGMVAVVVAGGFIFWYPVLAAVEIPREAWDLRILFSRWI
jgi:dolichyl-phosphate-mannose-protein mannosyltransferase